MGLLRDCRCDGEFKRPGLGRICGQLLFKSEGSGGVVEIKCPRCKQIKTIRIGVSVMATT